MAIKQLLSQYEKLANMSSASMFTLTGNEEVLEIDSGSDTGIRIKQYIDGKKNSVLVKLKEDIGNL